MLGKLKLDSGSDNYRGWLLDQVSIKIAIDYNGKVFKGFD